MADITSELVADITSECLADLLRNTHPAANPKLRVGSAARFARRAGAIREMAELPPLFSLTLSN